MPQPRALMERFLDRGVRLEDLKAADDLHRLEEIGRALTDRRVDVQAVLAGPS